MSRGDHAAVVDDRDVLADVLDELELMAREEHRRAAGRLAAEHLGERAHGERIEPGEGLVEHEQLGLVQQRRRELGALLVAVRELLDLRAGAIGETEPLEPRGRRRACRAAAETVQGAEVGELLAERHPRVEAALLRHVAEPQPLGQTDRPPAPEHLTGVQLDQPEDGAHRRRLSRAVRAQEAEHATRRTSKLTSSSATISPNRFATAINSRPWLSAGMLRTSSIGLHAQSREPP